MTVDGTPASEQSHSAEEIREWLRRHLAEILKRDPGEIDVSAPLDRYGLDSATAVGVTLDLEDWLGRPIEPAIFYDYATIEELAAALALGAGTSADQKPPLP
jgi:acyl carrier protein